MVTEKAQNAPQPTPEAGATVGGDRAWYLYGVTRSDSLIHDLLERTRADVRDAGEALQALICGDLAAIVRPVSSEEFGPEPLEKHLQDVAWLEAVVRAHNDVIAVFHRGRAILPAKFGSVYRSQEDLRAALTEAHDALVRQLDRLTECDEWAIHLYVDRDVVEQRVGEMYPELQRLREDVETARPGRAYLLQRQLDAELASATDAMLSDVALAAFERLQRHAVAGETTSPVRADDPDAEILRAAFLVRRHHLPAFLSEADSITDAGTGVRCEYSGPWPPYSFAAPGDEVP